MAHVKHWQIAASLGSVELELGKYRAAEQHLSFAQGASDLPAEDRARIARWLDRARAKLGTIWIEATAQGLARVYLDDEMIGATPFNGKVTVEPGDHRIELRLGEMHASRSVKVAGGATETARVELLAPELGTPLPTGAPGDNKPLAAPEGSATSVADKPPSHHGPSWPLVLTLGGAAIAGGAVGAGLWSVADSDGHKAADMLVVAGIKSHADCAKIAQACAKIGDLLKSQDTLQTGAALSWTLSGVAAIGAIATWAVTRHSALKTNVELVPVLAPAHAGVVVRGSW